MVANSGNQNNASSPAAEVANNSGLRVC